MSLFDLSDCILSVMSEDASSTYNGKQTDVIIDLDAEVEDENGLFVRKNLASVKTPCISKPDRGDRIGHEGSFYSVQNVVSIGSDFTVMEVRKE